jgi:hypothetical protein
MLPFAVGVRGLLHSPSWREGEGHNGCTPHPRIFCWPFPTQNKQGRGAVNGVGGPCLHTPLTSGATLTRTRTRARSTLGLGGGGWEQEGGGLLWAALQTQCQRASPFEQPTKDRGRLTRGPRRRVQRRPRPAHAGLRGCEPALGPCPPPLAECAPAGRGPRGGAVGALQL